MKRIALLGIDLQNDFTSPAGSLFVKGADKDTLRIADFILRNQEHIDFVALTLDSHQPIHIAHQCYWKNKEGKHPELFSTIKLEELNSGQWEPQYNQELAKPYLEQLELQNETCTIWPMHCIIGTTGWAIDQAITDALSTWAINNNKSYELFYKGYTQSTEHYSIFRAAVEWESMPETHLNTSLLNKLAQYDEIILVGEAADFCVANSLKDVVEERPELAKKITILSDCMSWIITKNPKALEIFKNAEQLGLKTTTSEDYKSITAN